MARRTGPQKNKTSKAANSSAGNRAGSGLASWYNTPRAMLWTLGVLAACGFVSWLVFKSNAVSPEPALETSQAAKVLPKATDPRLGPPQEELIQLDSVCANIAPQHPSLAPGNPAPSTRRMAQRLVEFNARAQPASMGYLSDRFAAMLESQLAKATNNHDRVQLQYKLAVQQMNSARPDLAINTLATMERGILQNGGAIAEDSASDLFMRRGTAYLRLGEQENCLAVHNPDSCIFPLKTTAKHVLPRGSRRAIEMFAGRLASNTNDFKARWLLNLAHMTLDEYPSQVDPRYLIPPSAFDSEYPMPLFRDISEGLELDFNDLAGGVIVDDFDNDGFDDLVVSAWDLKGQIRFLRNNGQGGFAERTSEAGLVGETGSLNIQHTDYNNDGFLDIWMLRGAWLGQAGRIPNSLLRNNGDGTFTDVTEEAGLLSFHPTQASRWFDYDGDGWLDLFIGNESTDPGRPDFCELFHNNRNGTFTECAAASGIRVAAFVKGVACADYDNDGRPDLFLSLRQSSPRILLHNDGPDASGQWRFSDATTRAGITSQEQSFGTFFFDFDNDGWEDLMILGYYLENGSGDVAMDYLGLPNPAAKQKFYRNNGNGTFTDITIQARINRVVQSMGHNYGDLDNDGWIDFYCGTGDPDFTTLIPNRMFRNAEGKFFQDVTTATGTGHLQKGHAVVFADMDEDGDQDIYSSLGGAYSGDLARNALFLNPGGTNRWLKLKLVGTQANRPAIGARITVVAQTPAGTRELHRVVSGGGNFGSNPFRQDIGLGDATDITSVEILWPGSNTRQKVTGLELNHSYRIVEGQSNAQAVPLHPVKLERSKPATHGAKLHAGLP